LTYLQQRYYDPVAGRFLSTDPVLTDANTGKSFNRYVYANNNPYKYIDPDGRDALTVEGGLGFYAGLTIGYNVEKRELAVTLNLAAGAGGGISYDRRSNENGRMDHVEGSVPKNTSTVGGLTVAAYGKANITAGPISVGGKVGGGTDLVTGQKVGEFSKEESFQKVGAGLSKQGGVEISLYADVGKVKDRIVDSVKEALHRITPKLLPRQ
jgi:uncharacterized protein RhaS with RHS repeats